MPNVGGVRKIASDDMLDDIRRVHAELGYVNQEAYRDHGIYSAEGIRKRFHTWLEACAAAGVESRSHTGTVLRVHETEERPCLGPGPDHVFQAIKNDLTHRICDACKRRTAPDAWDRIAVADGWEVVGA